MKRSTKAALLSGLVFPGAGHFYLKRWVQGTLLSAAAAIALYLITSVAWHTAMDIVGQIQSGAVAGDLVTIATLAEQRLQESEGQTSLATIVLTASWVIGIAGSYWLGRATEASHEQL